MKDADRWRIALRFFVPGVPAPGGSKKSFRSASTGKIVTVDDAKNNKGWRDTVAFFAQRASRELLRGRLLDEPLRVEMAFYRERPKSHHGTGRNEGQLKASALSAEPTSKPDALKLARSTEDAMTGVVWRDDASTVELSVTKAWGKPGAEITIYRRQG